MKNNLVFRIIGAFSSSLIILSVFMSFTNITAISLWDMYNNLDMLYMPIMIIVFGCIGVLFFSLNIKTEFAYATSGAMIFFTVMQLVQAIMNDSVSSLGLGFYFVAIGGVVTGIMAFLCNLKKELKKVVGVNKSLADNQISNMMVNQESHLLSSNNQSNINNQIEPVQNNEFQYNEVQSNISNSTIIQNQNLPIPEVSGVESQKKDEHIPILNSSNLGIQDKPDILINDDAVNSITQNQQVQPEIIPNIVQNQQVQPEIIPNIEQNPQSQPIININQSNISSDIENSKFENSNPVIRDFVNTNVQQSQPINSSSNSSNMQNLDIFGNFN